MSTQPIEERAGERPSSLRLRQVTEVPANFPEFADEVGEGLGSLYGPRAAEWYREVAPRALQEAIRQSAVSVWGIFDRTTLCGLLIGMERRGVGHISFVHVLSRYVGRNVEARLVRTAVTQYRNSGVDGILAEYVPLCPLDLAYAYNALGFEYIERGLMNVPTSRLLQNPTRAPLSYAAPAAEFPDVADVIVDAYQGHPGRRLHVEVRERAHALAYVQQVADGDFGVAHDGFIRLIRRDGLAIAAILGCETAPDCGFILQVAVRRSWQGKGLGEQLIHHLAQEFDRVGLVQTGLGVTLDNPARRLYGRLGFELVRPVDAHVWWRTPVS